MATEDVQIQNIDQYGFINDAPAVKLPAEAFSDASNVRFDDGAVRKIKGHKEIFSDHGIEGDIIYSALWPNPNVTYYVIVVDSDNTHKVYTLTVDTSDGTSKVVERTPSGGLDSDATSYQHTLFLGGYSFILNNGYQAPIYITDTQSDSELADSVDFAALPNWESYTVPADDNPDNTEDVTVGTVTAGIIQSFGNLLMAGDLKEFDGDGNLVRNLGGIVRSSNVASPGEIPQNWDPFATGAGTAEELTLAETGQVTAMKPLKNGMYIYTSDSIHLVQLSNNPSQPLTTNQISNTYGAIAQNAVFEFEGQHIVVGSNDIYTFGGNPGSIQSIADGRIRRYFYDNINPNAPDNIFILRNQLFDEIWICYSNTAALTQYANEAVIFNYINNTWTKRDLPDVSAGFVGPAPGGGAPSALLTFDSATDTGDAGQLNLGRNEVQSMTVPNTLRGTHDGVNASFALSPVVSDTSFTANQTEIIDLTLVAEDDSNQTDDQSPFGSGPNLRDHVETLTIPNDGGANWQYNPDTTDGGGRITINYPSGITPSGATQSVVAFSSIFTGNAGAKTPTQVATALTTAINNDEVSALTDFTATSSGAVITLTSDVAGDRSFTSGSVVTVTGQFTEINGTPSTSEDSNELVFNATSGSSSYTVTNNRSGTDSEVSDFTVSGTGTFNNSQAVSSVGFHEFANDRHRPRVPSGQTWVINGTDVAGGTVLTGPQTAAIFGTFPQSNITLIRATNLGPQLQTENRTPPFNDSVNTPGTTYSLCAVFSNNAGNHYEYNGLVWDPSDQSVRAYSYSYNLDGETNQPVGQPFDVQFGYQGGQQPHPVHVNLTGITVKTTESATSTSTTLSEGSNTISFDSKYSSVALSSYTGDVNSVTDSNWSDEGTGSKNDVGEVPNLNLVVDTGHTYTVTVDEDISTAAGVAWQQHSSAGYSTSDLTVATPTGNLFAGYPTVPNVNSGSLQPAAIQWSNQFNSILGGSSTQAAARIQYIRDYQGTTLTFANGGLTHVSGTIRLSSGGQIERFGTNAGTSFRAGPAGRTPQRIQVSGHTTTSTETGRRLRLTNNNANPVVISGGHNDPFSNQTVGVSNTITATRNSTDETWQMSGTAKFVAFSDSDTGAKSSIDGVSGLDVTTATVSGSDYYIAGQSSSQRSFTANSNKSVRLSYPSNNSSVLDLQRVFDNSVFNSNNTNNNGNNLGQYGFSTTNTYMSHSAGTGTAIPFTASASECQLSSISGSGLSNAQVTAAQQVAHSAFNSSVVSGSSVTYSGSGVVYANNVAVMWRNSGVGCGFFTGQFQFGQRYLATNTAGTVTAYTTKGNANVSTSYTLTNNNSNDIIVTESSWGAHTLENGDSQSLTKDVVENASFKWNASGNYIGIQGSVGTSRSATVATTTNGNGLYDIDSEESPAISFRISGGPLTDSESFTLDKNLTSTTDLRDDLEAKLKTSVSFQGNDPTVANQTQPDGAHFYVTTEGNAVRLETVDTENITDNMEIDWYTEYNDSEYGETKFGGHITDTISVSQQGDGTGDTSPVIRVSHSGNATDILFFGTQDNNTVAQGIGDALASTGRWTTNTASDGTVTVTHVNPPVSATEEEDFNEDPIIAVQSDPSNVLTLQPEADRVLREQKALLATNNGTTLAINNPDGGFTTHQFNDDTDTISLVSIANAMKDTLTNDQWIKDTDTDVSTITLTDSEKRDSDEIADGYDFVPGKWSLTVMDYGDVGNAPDTDGDNEGLNPFDSETIATVDTEGISVKYATQSSFDLVFQIGSDGEQTVNITFGTDDQNGGLDRAGVVNKIDSDLADQDFYSRLEVVKDTAAGTIDISPIQYGNDAVYLKSVENLIVGTVSPATIPTDTSIDPAYDSATNTFGTAAMFTSDYITESIDTDLDVERPVPTREFDNSKNFVILTDNVNGKIFCMDLGYQFDDANYESYVERKNLHLVPARDVESVHSFSIEAEGDSDAELQVRLETVNAAGKPIDLSDTDGEVFSANFKIDEDYKVDVRKTGRFAGYRITDKGTDDKDWQIAMFGIEVGKGGKR